MKKTVILCILDGWGHSEQATYNPIIQGHTPNWDKICATAPQSLVQASGEAVGLPDGQMGNSEVGHLNLGAGRIIFQSLPRITKAFAEDFLASYQPLNDALQQLKADNCVHILGLLSEGGVHSHQQHMIQIANHIMAHHKKCVIHGFSDGRDCPPTSAKTYFKNFQQQTDAPIKTLCGRYFVMDRDKNWKRTLAAYHAIAHGMIDDKAKQHFVTANEAIDAYYQQNISDEFMPPTIIGDYDGMKAGDIVICSNFRADRVRQIMALLANIESGIEPSQAIKSPQFAALFGMCDYSESLNQKLHSFFPPIPINMGLGETLALAGKTQLRLAETEKYAHVTYFFNGGIEQALKGETRILVPSPKIATYDLQPEMAAQKVTDHLCEAIDSGSYDFIAINYANPDMVGHSGKMEAAIKAVEFIDKMLGRVLESIDRRNRHQPDNVAMLLTADHGNIEIMFDEQTQKPHTAHSCNLVKLSYYGDEKINLQEGVLADIAPSLLHLMAIKQPVEMSGTCLIT
ncbi:MAG: 2,3-bisphosphoglycerate-independent phosphoglycerate mutase [Alphaproteobacteria bacterium]|nr:2,3-bisphosphoglycerate-independent phosphoglycerate mutase [Alphaproteobacteria bacterium]